MKSKKAIVIHSGGMDSSISLALAIKDFSAKDVLSLTFTYGQRHSSELKAAKDISEKFGVDHIVLNIDCLQEITTNSLVDKTLNIYDENKKSTTLVVGRNGLMVRIAAIHANNLGANTVYTGVIGVEAANSGYRDCSREYMDLMQEILRIDLADPSFEIKTPVVHLDKKETLELAYDLGILKFLLEKTITCYEGKSLAGCKVCPACVLRNEGLKRFSLEHPEFEIDFDF